MWMLRVSPQFLKLRLPGGKNIIKILRVTHPHRCLFSNTWHEVKLLKEWSWVTDSHECFSASTIFECWVNHSKLRCSTVCKSWVKQSKYWYCEDSVSASTTVHATDIYFVLYFCFTQSVVLQQVQNQEQNVGQVEIKIFFPMTTLSHDQKSGAVDSQRAHHITQRGQEH